MNEFFRRMLMITPERRRIILTEILPRPTSVKEGQTYLNGTALFVAFSDFDNNSAQVFERTEELV